MENRRTKPTIGALRRFEKLPNMIPAHVVIPDEDAETAAEFDATVIDISPGVMCMRVNMDSGDALDIMRSIDEGRFVESRVTHNEARTYTVLGRVAWLWVPSMEGDDQVGSLGVDIKGVAEEDPTFLGKLRSLFDGDAVDVDRSSKIIKKRSLGVDSASDEAVTEPTGDETEEPDEAEADQDKK